MSQTTRNVASLDLSEWLRVAIYDQPKNCDDLFYLGTLYGKSPDRLGIQVAKILRTRWRIDPVQSRIDRSRYEISVSLSHTRDLILSFSTPGLYGHRVKAQWFGSFLRSVFSCTIDESPVHLAKDLT